MVDVVYYHGKCSDGFGCAMILYHYYATKFSVERAKEIKFLPYFHSKPFIDFKLITGKCVLMLDFSPPLKLFQHVVKRAKFIKIIDHHPNTVNIPEKYRILDTTKAAVEITWERFFKTKLPKFLKYIAKRDMGDFSSEKGMSFCKYLDSQPQVFHIWRKYLDEVYVKEALSLSAGWNARDKILMYSLMNSVSFTIYEIDDEYCIAASINTILFRSELGDRLMKKYPFIDFAILWSYSARFGQTSISLRSDDDHTDVNDIARYHGGGGHRNASSCMIEGCQPELNYPVPDHADEFITAYLKRGENSMTMPEEWSDIMDEEKYSNLFAKLFPEGCVVNFT